MSRIWIVVLLAACGRLGFEVHDDATTDAAIPPNLVFVTSTTQSVGALGSLAAADAICRQRATAGSLPGTFVAWLSTSTVNAKDRIGGARGWARRDGRPFADTVDDIISSRIAYPNTIDEVGTEHTMIDAYTVTNTTAAGIAQAGSTCNDLTSAAANGIFGINFSGAFEWTNFSIGPGACGGGVRLYCFGIDAVAPLHALAPQRRAFVTTASWSVGGGVGPADALCAAEASAGGLTGTYLALLSTATASAASRFALGAPWSRLDGTVVTTDFSDWIAPLDETATGMYLDENHVWTGATDPTQPGSAATTCASWTSTATTGLVGYCSRSGPSGFDNSNQLDPCTSATAHVYCFEQ